MVESQNLNVGYFIKPLVGKWIRSLKSLLSISSHNFNSIAVPPNASSLVLVRGTPIDLHRNCAVQWVSHIRVLFASRSPGPETFYTAHVVWLKNYDPTSTLKNEIRWLVLRRLRKSLQKNSWYSVCIFQINLLFLVNKMNK